jgi:MYXO-CTERM domain-containing protein
MTRYSLSFGAALAALGLTLLSPGSAYAGLESCGNIDVQADAQCEAVAGVDCKTRCEQVSFEAACQGNLEAGCSTQCEGTPPTVECTGSCESDCQGTCEVQPAEFSCSGDCQATCEGDCSAQCGGDAGDATCQGQCSASCEGQCSVSCEGQPADATCEAQCSASCEGSCTVDGTFSCETTCQTEGYASCEAELQGGCEVQCDDPDGAIFCDGQYVDRGDNFQKCMDALKDVVNVEVQASSSGSCEGNSCEGQAQATCQCTTPGRRAGDSTLFGALGALALAGAVGLRRRR